MRYIILLNFLFIFNVFASDKTVESLRPDVKIISVSDRNREEIAGVKIELVGIRTYYTNIKGECYIPIRIFNQCQVIQIESISYKSITIDPKDINSKIILEFR